MVDSVPEFVMRTGVLSPFSPSNVRQDVSASHINRLTQLPIDQYSAPAAAAAGTMGYFGYSDLGLGFEAADVKWFAAASAAGSAIGAGIGAATSKRGNRGKGALYGAIGGIAASLTALIVNRAIR